MTAADMGSGLTTRRDNDRARVYKAEELTFFRPWYSPDCVVACLSKEDFLALHHMVVEFCQKKHGELANPARSLVEAPSIRFSRKNICHYHYSRNRITYGKTLTPLAIIHEVAHWATVGDAHGPRFRSVLTMLIREFIGPSYAEKFLLYFAGARRSRRTFVLQSKVPGGSEWTDVPSGRAIFVREVWGRSMRYGDHVQWGGHWFRMIEKISEEACLTSPTN